MSDQRMIIEESTDADAIARQRQHRVLADRNWKWLKDHWQEIASRASGKFIAVAGQELVVADTLEAALAWTKSSHADDDGAIVQYVMPPRGPRSYAVGR